VLDASYHPSKLRIPGVEDTDEATMRALVPAEERSSWLTRRIAGAENACTTAS
jgi:hypothetical protein